MSSFFSSLLLPRTSLSVSPQRSLSLLLFLWSKLFYKVFTGAILLLAHDIRPTISQLGVPLFFTPCAMCICTTTLIPHLDRTLGEQECI
jgi:hypothetical protein